MEIVHYDIKRKPLDHSIKMMEIKLTDVAVRLIKVTITVIGSDAIFGHLQIRCFRSYSDVTTGIPPSAMERCEVSLNPFEMETDKNSWL